ncbi:hypothetical protein ACSTIE_23635, partial [Vibrio parahaemolyticus]
NYPLHFAIAEAIGAHASVQPFDQYQGPYISVGEDFRSGDGVYALAPRMPGITRLWLQYSDQSEVSIYNEANNKTSASFYEENTQDAISAA